MLLVVYREMGRWVQEIQLVFSSEVNKFIWHRCFLVLQTQWIESWVFLWDIFHFILSWENTCPLDIPLVYSQNCFSLSLLWISWQVSCSWQVTDSKDELMIACDIWFCWWGIYSDLGALWNLVSFQRFVQHKICNCRRIFVLFASAYGRYLIV